MHAPDRHSRPGRLSVLLAVAALLAAAAAAQAQSIDKQLDEQRYLDGLVTLRLPEVLEQYIATHPTDDPIRQATFEIARQRMLLADRGIPPAARDAAVERLGVIRRGLADKSPGDPRASAWLSDQASDIWYELLPVEATGITALLGVPTASQRRRAARAAAEMNELTALAEIEIDDALRRIESSPGFAADVALRRDRARLADVERDQRIPFFRGLAALLHAELNVESPDELRELREIAAETLVPLGDRLHGRLAAEALLFGGLAQARLGLAEAAQATLQRCIEHPGAEPVDRFAAALAQITGAAPQVDLRTTLARLDALERDRPRTADALARLLLADQRSRLYRDQAERSAPVERANLLRAAAQSYLDLLGADGSEEDGLLHAAVRERLRETVGSELPLESLPAMVSIARAIELAADGVSRDEAVDLFEQVLRRADLDDGDRAEAEFGLARARLRQGDAAVAARSFIDLARALPAQPRAERAVEIGVAIARDLAERDPDDAEASRLLREGIDLLLARYPNLSSVDDWRFLAGRLALADARFEDARAHFGKITTDAETWPDAVVLQMVAMKTMCERERDPAAQARCVEALLEHLATSRSRLGSNPDRIDDPAQIERRRAHAATLRIMEADTRREQGDAEAALALLDGMESEDSIDPGTIGQALRVRFLALRRLARPAEAMGEVRRLVDRAPAAAEGILVPLLAALRVDAQQRLAMSRDAEAAALVTEMSIPLAEVLDTLLDDRGRGATEAWDAWREVADAYRMGDRPAQALAIYDTLLASRPDDLIALCGRAECLFAQGESRLADAMLIYRRIAAAGTSAGSPYWLSQLRMLQILDRTDRNTHKIVPRIQRLRREDAELGGDRLRRGFERLQGKYS